MPNAVRILDSPNTLLEANIIGTNLSGDRLGPTPPLVITTAVMINSSDNSTIRGNIIGDYDYGITTNPGTSPLSITGLTIEDNVIGTNNEGAELGKMGTANYGILVSPNTYNSIIRNNTVANYGVGMTAAQFQTSPTPQMFSHNITMLGNTLGITPNGQPLGNGTGITAGCAENTIIGGLGAGEGNIVANSTTDGIRITNYGACNINSYDYSVIGNTIYSNGRNGVSVIGTNSGYNEINGMTIRQNSIYGNGGIGIDLVDDTQLISGSNFNSAVTPNGPAGTLRDGPNHLVNYPMILDGVRTNGPISGTYDGMPNTTYSLDFYVNDVDAREGRTYIGTIDITTDGNGEATFSHDFGFNFADGDQFITITATSPTGNTSEYSQPFSLPPTPPIPPDPVDPPVNPPLPPNAGIARLVSVVPGAVAAFIILLAIIFVSKKGKYEKQ